MRPTERPVRVLVDLSLAPPGGAGTYAAGFASGLVGGDISDRDQIVVVLAREWAQEHQALTASMRGCGLIVDVVDLAPPGTWKARLGRGAVLRKAAKRHQVEVAYFPREVVPRTNVAHVLLANNLYGWRRFGSGAAIGGRGSAFLLRRLARSSARRAAAVLSVSGVLAAVIAEESGDMISVAAVVHHGCGLAPFDRDEGEGDEGRTRRVLMVGNVIANKGMEVVVEGVAIACSRGVDWRLDVFGGRGDEAYARGVDLLAVERLGGPVLRGPAYGDALAGEYRAADVVVMGDAFESFCFPLVEAMRSGCVVVAPACDLVDEICEHVACTFVPGDASSLADALELAWVQRVARSRAGVERSAVFTWERTAETTIDLVRSAGAAVVPR